MCPRGRREWEDPEWLTMKVWHSGSVKPFSVSRTSLRKRCSAGLAFMVRGNMCCGVIGEELMVRVGPEGYETALTQPHARKMDFTGKPLKGFVYVESDGFDSDDDLQAWVDRALEFVLSLSAK